MQAWKPRPVHCGPATWTALAHLKRMARKGELKMSEVKEAMEIRINVQAAKEGSNLRAFASFRVDVPVIGPMAFNHIRVLEGSKGLFVSLPAQKKGEGQTAEWFDHYHPVTADGRKAIGELILEKYEEALADAA